MATATSAATRALFSASARLAGMLRPSVASAMRPSTNGVIAAPVMPAVSSRPAPDRAPPPVRPDRVRRPRDRHGQQHPRRRPRRGGQHTGDLGGGFHAVRRGQSGRPGVEGGEPVVTPAEHRHPDRLEILERPGEIEERLRSGAHRDHVVVGEGVEVGGDVAGVLRPRWTPPMPPVANTETPAAAAMPRTPTPSRRRTPTTGRSPPGRRARPSCGPARGCVRSRRRRSPTRTIPSSTAVTAGIAPPSRIAAAQRSSASRLAGDGRPRLEKIVDSSATTGAASASAVATSSEQVGVITVAVCHDPKHPPGACPPGDRPRRTFSRRGREPGDRLDVRRVREQVEHLHRFRHVAALGQQGDVAGERHRVAADEHEHRRATAVSTSAPGLPRPVRAGSATTTSTGRAGSARQRPTSDFTTVTERPVRLCWASKQADFDDSITVTWPAFAITVAANRPTPP